MAACRLLLTAAVAVVVPLALAAQAPSAAQQLDLARALSADGRYRDATGAFRRALAAGDAGDDIRRDAHAGLAIALLRTGDFTAARGEAERASAMAPASAALQSLYGDTLWAAGLFDEGEQRYEEALRLDPADPRGHHGRARALAARSRFTDALAEAGEAVRLAPADGELHHTIGVIYERQNRFDAAAAAFGRYLSLLPNRDRSETALWTRAQIRFLDTFHDRVPNEIIPGDGQRWTVPLRIANDKVIVKVRVNGSRPKDFVLDTGAEQTVISRDLARRERVAPITYMQSAGVGDVGLRGLQIGRIDSLEVGDLQVRNVPCLIKNPPLGELPAREPESFSPLALGLSMQVDYARRELVMTRALPPPAYATELPLRMHRLATVRGIVNGQPASFVVDTGGQVISISTATAGAIPTPRPFRRIPLKVYGTSGWDRDAFLMPNVDLEFSSIRFSGVPVVVLNLNAPSALLGFNLGGIVGHKFLSRYRVSIDLQRSVLGLDPAS